MIMAGSANRNIKKHFRQGTILARQTRTLKKIQIESKKNFRQGTIYTSDRVLFWLGKQEY
jgi:hypothetical protein